MTHRPGRYDITKVLHLGFGGSEAFSAWNQ